MTKHAKIMRQKKIQKRRQKLIGLGLLLISVCYFYLALTGTTVEERDCTALFLILPMSLYMLFSKNINIK